MKQSALVLITILLFSCAPKTKAPEKEPKQILWAVKMADAVMAFNESYYLYKWKFHSFFPMLQWNHTLRFSKCQTSLLTRHQQGDFPLT